MHNDREGRRGRDGEREKDNGAASSTARNHATIVRRGSPYPRCDGDEKETERKKVYVPSLFISRCRAEAINLTLTTVREGSGSHAVRLPK